MDILFNDTAELKQCTQSLNSALSLHIHVNSLLFNSRVLRNYTGNSIPYLATRSKVDSSIPIIEKTSMLRLEPVTFRSRALQGNPSATPLSKPHTSIEYINIMIVQQTCAILDDCQRLPYR